MTVVLTKESSIDEAYEKIKSKALKEEEEIKKQEIMEVWQPEKS